VLLSGSFFGTLACPAYEPSVANLFQAIPLGLLGGVAGLSFFAVLRGMQRAMQPLKSHLICAGCSVASDWVSPGPCCR
jgi:hypothetical protein